MIHSRLVIDSTSHDSPENKEKLKLNAFVFGGLFEINETDNFFTTVAALVMLTCFVSSIFCHLVEALSLVGMNQRFIMMELILTYPAEWVTELTRDVLICSLRYP